MSVETDETIDTPLTMIGELIGNYRITGQIGSGGMGAVYEAVHNLLGKKAAVKLLLPERAANHEIVERFFNEAKATSLISDPGIVEIFDYGHLPNGHAYIVMELLEGETLGDRLRRSEQLTVTQAIAIAWHIAGALGVAHKHGIIHRDLKPDNVFLVSDPAMPRGERAKVLDFGIAKRANSEDETDLLKTKTGQLLGTPIYMSPEQCRGAGGMDHRSDIYSLGCLLYHMLAGRPPFLGEGSGEVLAAHIHVPPTPLRALMPDIPESIDAIVMKLLEKVMEARYQSMDEVIAAFNEAVPSLGNAAEPSLEASGRFPTTGGNFGTDETLNMTTGEGRRASSVPVAPNSAQIMTPQHTNTEDLEQRSKLSIIMVPMLLTAVVVGVVTYSFFGTSSSSSETPAPVASPAADATSAKTTDTEEHAKTIPVIEPVIETPETPEIPKRVKLTIDSFPSGAKIYRVADGVKVGTTPMTISLRGGEGQAAFFLRKSGYRRAEVFAPVDRDSETKIVLERRGRDEKEDEAPETVVPKDGKQDETTGDKTGKEPGDKTGKEPEDKTSKEPGDKTGNQAPEKDPKGTESDNKTGNDRDKAIDPFATP